MAQHLAFQFYFIYIPWRISQTKGIKSLFVSLLPQGLLQIMHLPNQFFTASGDFVANNISEKKIRF